MVCTTAYFIVYIKPYTMIYTVIYICVYIMLHTLIHVTLQLGLLLPLNVDDARVFSASERLAQEHVKKYKTGAAELKDLIQQVLHHQDFNPQDVDHDMHQRLMDCIAQGGVEQPGA
jgi:hypothetical protein